jgi:flavin reductase (DIM6/NTAB) family NADH-FMN oxidoreductase RutF/DNA-binding MarR family transcriptional regulator
MTTPLAALSGDPVVDSRGFRQCLGQFSTGVTIVTAEHDDQRVGVTANSFSSLSLDPPLILWSINRTSRAFPVFAEAKHFAISILADDQVDVSQRFASKETDKFATIAWHAGENGAPMIDGSAARLECSTEILHDGGDHVLIIGRVTRFAQDNRKVLIFSQGRYSLGVDHPVLRNETGSASSGQDRDAAGSATFGSLVFKAHLRSSHSFDTYRSSLGLSIGEGRILYVLSEHPALSFDVLVRRSNLPAQVIEDAIADLTASGGLQRNVDETFSLTSAGKERRATARQQSLACEAETLEGISPEHLAITKQVLAQYIAQSDAAL